MTGGQALVAGLTLLIIIGGAAGFAWFVIWICDGLKPEDMDDEL